LRHVIPYQCSATVLRKKTQCEKWLSFTEMIRRIDALTGVELAAFTGMVILARNGFGLSSFGADRVISIPQERTIARSASHLSGFLPRLGVPILSGRDFTAGDGQKGPVSCRHRSVRLSQSVCFPIRMRRYARLWTDQCSNSHPISGRPHSRHRVTAIVTTKHRSIRTYSRSINPFKRVPLFWRPPFYPIPAGPDSGWLRRSRALFATCSAEQAHRAPLPLSKKSARRCSRRTV